MTTPGRGRGSKAWSKCTRVFNWSSPGARVWRARIGELAGVIQAANLDVLRNKLGGRWAYDLRNAILMDGEEKWRDFLGSLAANLTYQSREHSTGQLKTRHRKARDAVKRVSGCRLPSMSVRDDANKAWTKSD